MSDKGYISAAHFEGIFREMHSRLFYEAYDIVGNKQAAQDIVSEVFLSVWKQRESIDGDGLKGYLFISVRNKALDWYRRENAQKSVPVDCLKDMSDTERSWELREERIVKIENEIAQMTERTQTILDLCYRQRMTYKEAAQVVGISMEGIKKHLSRALKELRTKLKKE